MEPIKLLENKAVLQAIFTSLLGVPNYLAMPMRDFADVHALPINLSSRAKVGTSIDLP